MINLLTFFYPSASVRNKGVLNKFKLYSVGRFVIKCVANVVLPILFRVENVFTDKHRIECSARNKLIVSLTSFPARIDKLWLVIETIFRQTVKPDKIILWLSKEQFADKSQLPSRLLEQQKRGLTIIFCDDDIRSHKKYFYNLKKYPNSDLVTIDDDFFYPKTMIENLIKHYDDKNIIAHRAYAVKFTNTKHLSNYSEWKLLPDKKSSGLCLFATSGGGTLFPAGSLDVEVLNSSAFLSLCPLADDVWLYFAAVVNGTKTIKTDYKSMFIPILNMHNTKLSSVNLGENMNDKQIQRLLDYYSKEKGIDVEGILFSDMQKQNKNLKTF